MVVLCFAIQVASNIGSMFYNGRIGQAQLSNENPTYITPDGLTFAVWGLIYFGEGCGVVYQCLPKYRELPSIVASRNWICSAFLANALWLPVFQYEYWWLSLAVIVAYLYFLLKAHESAEINYGRFSTHSIFTKHFWFTGISMNYAWVVVATLLNVTVVARNSSIIITTVSEGVNTTTAGYDPYLKVAIVGGNVDWAVFVCVFAACLALYRAWKNADVPYTVVTFWALHGIYRMQGFENDASFPVHGRSKKLEHLAQLLSIAVLAMVALAIFRIFFLPNVQEEKEKTTTDLAVGLTASA